jgi:hypothetical protein
MFAFREKLSQVPPVPEDYNVTPPPLRIISPPCVATVYNKLTGGEGGWCVSIRAHSLPGPSFVHVWSFVCLSFLASPIAPQLRFLGQACGGFEKNGYNIRGFMNKTRNVNEVSSMSTDFSRQILIFNFFKLMAFFQTTLTSSHFVIRTVVK